MTKEIIIIRIGRERRYKHRKNHLKCIQHLENNTDLKTIINEH